MINPRSAAQRRVLARLRAGETVPSWDVHHTCLQALADRHVVTVCPTTCCLILNHSAAGERRSPVGQE